MADSGKKKTPASETRKAQDGGGGGGGGGSGKRRRKHKKPAEAAGGKAQSPAAGAPQQAQSQASGNLSQARLEGVKSSPKQREQEKRNNEVPGKAEVKQSELGVKDSEPAARNVSGDAGRERKNEEPPRESAQNHSGEDSIDGELPARYTLGLDCIDGPDRESHGKSSLKQESKDRPDGEPRGKSTPKQGSRDRPESESHGKSTPKQESKDRPESEPHGKSSPKQDGKDGEDGEPLSKGLRKQESKERQDAKLSTASTQMQPRHEKKGTETFGAGEAFHKQSSTQAKGEQGQEAEAEDEKVPEVEQKSKVKVKAETGKKMGNVGAEQKAKDKGEQRTKLESADGEQKSKAQLRAERRAIQEAQRAAKDARKNEAGNSSSSAGAANSSSTTTVKKEVIGDKSRPAAEATNGEKKSTKKKPAANAVILDETEEQMWARKEKEILGTSLKIDNSILSLGFQYFHHNIVGANARCLALLATLKEVIAKYRTPDEKELSRDLEKNFLSPCITYINYCRPTSTSMGNAIKHLKYHINRIPRDMTDEAAISSLQKVIDDFIQENIVKAPEAVALYADTKISDGDVILVYGASSLIGQVLKTNFKKGKSFRVIVVEGRPRTEGKSMLRYLVRCGIPCSYIYIGSASHAMSEATKVFLGAAAMFAIGDMYSRCGNSMIAALAKANNIPVLVCCETYKFTDKVQFHSGDSNLHTRGRDLISIGHRPPILANWEEIGLRLLNLMYDVTGSEYITALVTELGMLPCSSVPVVLRRQEDLSLLV